MNSFFAFLNGMREYRLSFTTHYTDSAEALLYERGREFAHRITFRRFDY